ncbi:Alpha/Beta hydrolase protein [Apiosordaria backusii]|uniref:Alpha/Beta hydrolase protein n=1 Tax=Apiosordaria backusii TaxID=314023 RepID=A0AA40EXQ5_9PEZI|nr:Alpha/Beta hydrolase protein [Apiosordaria backusii]
MIDHVLGRPSVKSRRIQVLAVLAFWTAYLLKGNKNGPPIVRFFSKCLSKRLTFWQTLTITMLYLYSARNFSTLVGLASPDPLANMYDATYFRATWILTALDAGFWTAMPLKTKWLRDAASIVFSMFYMVAAEKADEKVRKVRGNITVDHLRVSWNKGVDSPYLSALLGLMRPRMTKWPPRQVRIPRPSTSDYKEPVEGWLYFDGPLSELKELGHNQLVLDIPGGGFVAMDPRCNDDKLFAWAAKTGLPILSLDYKKAPEYPFPYALNECYDVYCTLIRSKGRCVGMSGEQVPKIVITGDSAGGTLATAMTIMITESGSSPIRRFQGQTDLPIPEALVLFYPALDMNIGSWMSDEQMALIKDRRMRGTNKRVLERKTMQYNDLVGTPHQSDDEDDGTPNSSGSTLRDSSDSTAVDPQHLTQEEHIILRNREPCLSPAPQYAHSNSTTFHLPPLTSPGGPLSPKTLAPQQTAAAAVSPDTKRKQSTSHHPSPLKTRLAMSSMISYFNDRVLTPEMMRAMIILYVGPHNRPDFSQDYLLCPILCPDVLLSRFPKTYFLTGERDPLVDDTVIFAGRLRRVKAAQMASNGTRYEYRDTDALTPGFDENTFAEVALIPGISHGFLQFPGVYPPAWGLFDKTGSWIEEGFREGERRRRQEERQRGRRERGREQGGEYYREHHQDDMNGYDDGERRYRGRRDSQTTIATAVTNGTEEDQGLEMRMSKVRPFTTTSDSNKKRERAATTLAVVTNGNGNGIFNGKEEAVLPKVTLSGDGADSTGSGSGSGSNGQKKKKKRRGVRTSRDDSDNGSLVKRLASSDDLLGRRMQGLAGGLTGLALPE